MSKKIVLFGCGGTGEHICVKISDVIASQNWEVDELPKFILIDTHSDNLKDRGDKIRDNTKQVPYTIQLKYDRVRQLLAYPNRTDNIPKLASCGLTSSTEDGKGKIKYVKGLLAAGADDNGARREPALGRLAMIAEWNDIKTNITNQIEEVLRGTTGDDLQCYVFSSSFGGTGAGIFIPLMYLLRKQFGDDIKIKLWLLDPSFGNVVHEGVSEEERERFYRNGYRILRELDYIQSGVTEKKGEGILPYKVDDPSVPDKELYGTPDSKFDNVLLFSRFLHGSKNNIEYDEALNKISEAFVHVVDMPNQVDENPGEFTNETTEKYRSASSGLRVYSSCSCGKFTFPQGDWSSLLRKAKEADLYEKALQPQNKINVDSFPGKTALDAFVSILRERIAQINTKLKAQLDDFSEASSEDAFNEGYKRAWNENKDDFFNKVETWFEDATKLAQSTFKSNVASAIALLENATNQAKTFKKSLENAKIPSYEINEDVKEAATRSYSWWSSKSKKNDAIAEYLDELCKYFQYKAIKHAYAHSLRTFERQKGVEKFEALTTRYVGVRKRLLDEQSNLLQQIKKEKAKVLEAQLVQASEFNKAEKTIIDLNGAALGGLNLDEPVCVLTDPIQKKTLQKELEKYCLKNATSVVERLNALLAPENSEFIDKMKQFRNSCAPLFNYAKGRGYVTDYDPEFSSYLFSNFGGETLGKLPQNIGAVFNNVQAVHSNKLTSNEVVFLTYLKGLRPDFSPCYHRDFEIAYKKQPREFQGSLDGRLEEFAEVAREMFKDYGPKEARSSETEESFQTNLDK